MALADWQDFSVAIVNDDRIDGWRDIALYLGRDERTAKRWEKQRGLPVRRIPGEGRANVYVLRSEVDVWLAHGPGNSTSAIASQIAESAGPQSSGKNAETPGSGDAVPAAEEIASTSQIEGGIPLVSSEVDDPLEPALEVDATPRPMRNSFQPSQHISLMVSLFGLLLLVAATTVRFFHLGPLESILFASESTVATTGSARAVSPEHDELYLRAVYLCERRSASSLAEAKHLFTEAIARNPKDAASYAGLAKTFLLLREYATMPEPQAYQAAKDAAEQALTLDPEQADAHAAMGFVSFFWEKRPEAAEREFNRAMESRDRSVLAHQWYGSMLMHQGRHAEALAQMTIAQQLDPNSAAILANKALATGFAGNRDEGVRVLESMESAGPDSAMVHRDLAYLSLMTPRNTGRFLAEARRFAEMRQDAPMVAVMRVAEETFAAHGETAMWRAVLEEERTFHPDAMHPSYLMAEAEAMLGHQDAALRVLEHLSADHDGGMLGIVLEPAFASLHKDAAFARMAEGMGLITPVETTR